MNPRLLNKSDVGKVFVRDGDDSHSNFGKYLILLSTDSEGLYAFQSFDIVDEAPVGKLVVSYAAKPIYTQVPMTDEFIRKAVIASEERMAQERRELWGQ